MKKSVLKSAVALALGATAMNASATVNYFDWDGVFTMISAGGSALGNSSITGKNVNTFQTPVAGTMAFDPVNGVGTATLVPFSLLEGTSPWEAAGIKLQTIGDGAGGAGTLVLGNMIFNWDGNNGIPVSIVMDAAGFFIGSQNGDMNDGVLNRTDVAGYGAEPASDGTYVGLFPGGGIPTDAGYLKLGPVPMATTEFDTTNINGCVGVVGGCINNDSSGGLPLITDTAPNSKEYARGDGVGLGGSPMQDGPFQFKNANFDVLELRFTGQDTSLVMIQGCTFVPGDACTPVPDVPVPAAVWLFGSGLLGLVGVARRKKSEV